jgi:YVTN family beta-propeller protein
MTRQLCMSILLIPVILSSILINFASNNVTFGINSIDQTEAKSSIAIKSLTYKNDTLGIRVQYPSNWSVNETSYGVTLVHSPIRNVYLSIFVLPSSNTTIGKMAIPESFSPGFKIFKSDEATLISDPTIHLQRAFYSFLAPHGVIIKAIKVVSIIDSKEYRITYSAPEDKFDRFFLDVQKIVNSLEISRVYENPFLGLQIKYPYEWHQQLVSKNNLKLFPPIESRVSLNIRTARLETGAALPNMEKNYLSNLAKNNLTYYQNFPNFTLNHVENNTNQALMTYSYRDEKSLMYVTNWWLNNNGMIYSIMYRSDSVNYMKYLPIITNITMQLKKVSFLGYENFDLGVKTVYPDTWNKTQGMDSVLFSSTQNNHVLVNISSTHNDKGSGINDAIDQVIEEKATQYRHSHFHLNGKKDLQNIQQSGMLNYSFVDPSAGLMNNTEIIAVMNDKIYSIRYSALENDYSKYLSTINYMINSMRLFGTHRYENIFDKGSGIILNYPDYYPWKLNTSNTSNRIRVNLMQINSLLLLDNISRNFQFSVFPYAGSLESLERNLTLDKLGSNFNITTFKLNATLNGHVIAHEIDFVHYNKNSQKYVKGLLVYAVTSNRHAYIINYTVAAPAESQSNDYYQRYLLTVRQIIDSLKIINVLPLPSNLRYFNSTSGIDIKRPLEWDVKDNGNFVRFNSRADPFTGLDIITSPLTDTNFFEMIASDIGQLITTNRNEVFDLIESNLTSVQTPEYQVKYRIGNMTYLSDYRLENNGNVYVIKYYSHSDDFYSYLQLIQQMISSFHIQKNTKAGVLTGLFVGRNPTSIAINSMTNIIYVLNGGSNSVSVLNGSNNNMIANIVVGRGPSAIAVDPVTNYIYVVNADSRSVSVIDGAINKKIGDILAGRVPYWIAVNSLIHKVYVADLLTHDVYIIDESTNRIDTTIHTGGIPQENGVGIDINPYNDRIYVANPVTHNVTVIDGDTNRIIKNISSIEKAPSDIAVNPFTNRAYVLDPGGIVEAIDLTTNNILGVQDINDSLLMTVAVNPFTSKLYVTDRFGSLHILNTSSFEGNILGKSRDNITTIKLDASPTKVTVNSDSNMIYVTNSLSDTVTTINGTSNRPVFGVTYHMNNPSNYTSVVCNGKKISENEHILYDNGTSVTCIAKQENPISPIIARNFSFSGLDVSPRSLVLSIPNFIFGFPPLVFKPSKLVFESSTPPVKFKVDRHSVLDMQFEDLSSWLREIGPSISITILISVVIIASLPSMRPKTLRNKGQKLVTLKKDQQQQYLDKGDIIGFNASVIAGVLVLLSILQGFAKSQQTQITIITANIIIPFAISAIVAANGKERFATRLMIAGFINLIISAVLIAIMKI